MSLHRSSDVIYFLADAHGIDTTEPLLNFTADGLWNSAKEAYAIGKKLGKKIILMATSTGGTLALKLAAEYPDIAGLILLSPNIEINDSKAWLLNNHWGLQIAKAVAGTYRKASDTTAIYAQYWNNKYRIESTVQLEELLESTMKKRMFIQLGTPDSLKRQVALPNTGDHVIGSYIKSKDVQSVVNETEKFATEILKMNQYNNN